MLLLAFWQKSWQAACLLPPLPTAAVVRCFSRLTWQM
jgi:hypothetical protein